MPRAALQDLTREKVSELKVPELRAELRALGLDDQGVRRSLVERLLAAVAGESKATDPATVGGDGGDGAAMVAFVVNASVGHMARVVGVFDGEYLLVLGDFTGLSSALNPKTGKVLWSSSSGLDSISNVAVKPASNLALCASGWTGNVSALQGEKSLWTLDAGVGEYSRVAWSSGTSSAIYGGGGSAHKVAGVDAESGVARYCVDSGIGAVWTICTGASHVICGGSWARPEHTALVACLDAASGARRWTTDPKVGRYIVTALQPDGGVAFCGGENGMVAALSPETGDVLWHSSSSVEEVWGLELVDDLVICSGGWSEQVSALDQQTGALRWGPVNASIGKVFSCSSAVPSLLLCGGSDGLAALNVNSGALRFTLDLKELGEIWSMVYDADTRLLFCGGNKERVAAVQL